MKMENVNAEDLQSVIAYTHQNLDDFFLILGAVLIFAMQIGFVLMEAGLVRSKTVVHVLLESTLDAFIGTSVYWLFGYAFCYGEGNDFIGWTNFALSGMSPKKYSFWFYQMIFANTASTITSGAVAERLRIEAFIIFSFLFTGVMYPIGCRWVWYHNGWLKRIGVVDYGGSGVVHMTGGVCALVGSLFIGPRVGRFNSKGTLSHMPGHSMSLTAVGALMLFFGFIGYNMSSQQRLSEEGDGPIVALSAINTLLCGASGAITAVVLGKLTPTGKYQYSFVMMVNGAITGMAASCAGCNAMPIWGAYITGIVAGFIFFVLRAVIHKLQIDDVLDAFPVHFGGGFTGMLLTPLLSYNGLLINGYSASANWLGNQTLGTLVLIAWSAAFSSLLFLFFKVTGILRVSNEVEEKGLDFEGIAEIGYPAESWGEDLHLVHRNKPEKEAYHHLEYI